MQVSKSLNLKKLQKTYREEQTTSQLPLTITEFDMTSDFVPHRMRVPLYKAAIIWFAYEYRKLRNILSGSTEPDRLLTFVKNIADEGDVPAILAACDKYCVEKEWIMHLGGEKGKVFREIIRECQPRLCLELGTYCGFSAILLAFLLPADGKVYTVEFSSAYAEAARALIKYARLDHKITVLCGDAGEVIPTLRDRYSLDKFDFVFIDHHKPFYCRDLKLLLNNDHLRKGTVVVADDLRWPGAPEYDEYVQKSKDFKSTFFDTKTVFFNILDVMGKSVYVGGD